MPTLVKDTGTNKYLHPEGAFAATCIDIIDLGEVPTTFKGREKTVQKVIVRFWAGQFTKEGEPLYAGGRFTKSIGERANLRKFLEAWRGKAFTEAELKGFDLDKLMGVPSYLQVTHRKGLDGATYANITSAMKLPPGLEMPAPLTAYVLVRDRKPDDQTKDAEAHKPDDDLPF